MTLDEPRALAMEALISELYGALSMAKLTTDVGALLIDGGRADLHRKGKRILGVQGTRHAERPGGVSRVHASPRRRPLLRGMRS